MLRQQLTEGSRFALKWITAILIGLILAPIALFAIAIGSWEILLQLFPDEKFNHYLWLFDGLFLFMLFLAVIVAGAFIGLAQWDLALKDRIRKRTWIAVNSIVIFAAYAGLFLWNELFPDIITLTGPSQVSGFVNPSRVSDTWLLGVVGLGLMVGTAVSFPQWLVLRRYVLQASWWVLANIAGVTAGMLTFLILVHLWQDYLLPLSVTYCFTGPLAFGAITGVVLFRLLQHRKQASD